MTGLDQHPFIQLHKQSQSNEPINQQEEGGCPNLEVSALGFQPVLDVALGISGEAEHEVPLDLQLVDGLDGLVDLKNASAHMDLKDRQLRSRTQRRAHLVVQRGDFLMVGGGEEEAAHLALQGVFHLHVDVVAGRFLMIGGVHANNVDHVSIKDVRGEVDFKFGGAGGACT